MIAQVASFSDLAGPDLIMIAIILAVLATPALIAVPIVFYIVRRGKKPPPLPKVMPTSPASEAPSDFVQHYVAELRHGNRDNAFHSLIEADPAIVPLLIAEFSREPDVAFRAELLRVIAEFRLPDTIPFFADRLSDAHWKIALDFLVSQASPEALRVLQGARARTFENQREAGEFRAWLEEAIVQAQSVQRT